MNFTTASKWYYCNAKISTCANTSFWQNTSPCTFLLLEHALKNFEYLGLVLTSREIRVSLDDRGLLKVEFNTECDVFCQKRRRKYKRKNSKDFQKTIWQKSIVSFHLWFHRLLPLWKLQEHDQILMCHHVFLLLITRCSSWIENSFPAFLSFHKG